MNEESSRGQDLAQGGDLPQWFPEWASRLAELYFSGTTSMFLLHGTTYDLTRIEGQGEARYGTLQEFLAGQLFGRWDLVLHYDLAHGLRPFAGADEARLKDMVALATRKLGDLSKLPKDPSTVLALLDRFVQRNIMAKDEDRLSTAVILDHASYVVPAGEPGRLGLSASTHLVTLLNWAASPYVKRLNMAFVLCDEKLSSLSERLSSNPHVASIDVPLPDEDERKLFIDQGVDKKALEKASDFDLPELAKLTAGVSLTDLNVLVRSTIEGGRRLDANVFRDMKKRLIERQAQGLLEFIEPKYDLDMVIGHEAGKARLREDAELLRRGALDTVPMGYLLCGAVGTGKTFLSQCASGSFGIPCVILKNFRSKYVGETEGNLERVLSVLRAMGPVVVVIDEADAALGDRSQDGDSGTSARVFGMIASQMGDTRYRGKILWMLLTCRPDLLPIDLKRQGRAEVHIPLFYPTEQEEIRDLFVVMGKKLGSRVAAEDVPEIAEPGSLSGADIEGLVGRAWRRSLIGGADHVTREALHEAIEQFMPSLEGLEKELQETAAILECTNRDFLPPAIRARMEEAGGRARLQERLSTLRRMVDAL